MTQNVVTTVKTEIKKSSLAAPSLRDRVDTKGADNLEKTDLVSASKKAQRDFGTKKDTTWTQAFKDAGKTIATITTGVLIGASVGTAIFGPAGAIPLATGVSMGLYFSLRGKIHKQS